MRETWREEDQETERKSDWDRESGTGVGGVVPGLWQAVEPLLREQRLP